MESQEDGTDVSATAAARKEALQRRSSKSRLSKQETVEELGGEEDTSPSSEASDATIVPTVGVEAPILNTPGEGSPEDDEAGSQGEGLQSTESEKSSPTQGNNPKLKTLIRSHALCDEGSPPPPDDTVATAPTVISVIDPSLVRTSTLQISPTPTHRLRPKLSKDSSQGSTVSENGTSPGLSRDSSMDYTDSTGTDLEAFIKNTLNSKQHKDRQMLLKLEREMIDFIKDNKSQFLKFPQMTSYHRMLVHRVAAFFGLDHNVDQSGKCVVVNRTPNTRLPDFRFRDHIMDECLSDEQTPKRLILKRDEQSHSFDDGRSPNRPGLDDKKSKSFDERVDEYEKVRARIFNQPESQSQEGILETQVSGRAAAVSAVPRGSAASARSSHEELPRWAAAARPWSSTDSSGYSTDSSCPAAKLKLAMTKASSFHGVTLLSRGVDGRGGGGYSGASNSISSGMSSLSSPMTRPPTIPSSPPLDPDTTISSAQPDGQFPFLQVNNEQGEPMAIWVATSLSMIPQGSIIINPQTGEPHTNPDGSVYRWQPPPPMALPPKQPATSPSSSAGMLSVPSVHSSPYCGGQQQAQSPPDNRSFSLDSSGESGVLSNNFSQLSVTPSDPGGGDTPGQIYMLTSPPQSSQYQQPQQMQYYAPSQPALRYVYPTAAAGQQQLPTSATAEQQYAATGQYVSGGGGQYYPAAMMGAGYHPQVAVQTVDGNFATVAGQQQVTTYPTTSTYNQAAGAGVPPSQDTQQQGGTTLVYQALPGSQPVYYSTTAQGAFRSRTPPNAVAASASANSQPLQIVSYSPYPMTAAVAAGGAATQPRVPTPVQNQQQQATYSASGGAITSPPSAQQQMQPNGQAFIPRAAQAMSMPATRTTPPPLQFPPAAAAAAAAAAAPIKMFAAGDMKPAAEFPKYPVTAMAAAAVVAQQRIPQQTIVFRPQAAQVSADYGNNGLADSRLLGQPLQQLPRPITPMMAMPPQTRSRVPTPSASATSINQALNSTPKSHKSQGRRSWSKANSSSSSHSDGGCNGTSPLSSAESTESSGSYSLDLKP